MLCTPKRFYLAIEFKTDAEHLWHLASLPTRLGSRMSSALLSEMTDK